MAWTRSFAILVVLAFSAEAGADKVDWSSYIDHDSKPMPVAAAKPLAQATPAPAAKPAKSVAKAKPKARTSAKPKAHHK